MALMLVVLWDVNLYAGRGGLCCCCDCDDEDASLNRAPLIPKLGTKWISDYEDFKRYFTADGDCEMRTSMYASIPIKEDVKAGRGSKSVLIEEIDFRRERVGSGIYIYIESGTTIYKGSVIDYEKGGLYRPGDERRVRFYK